MYACSPLMTSRFLLTRNLGSPFTHEDRTNKVYALAAGVETFSREVKANYGPTVPTWYLGQGRLWSGVAGISTALVDSADDIEKFVGLIARRSILWEIRCQGMGFFDVHRGFNDEHVGDCFGHFSYLGVLKACENLEDFLYSYYAIPSLGYELNFHMDRGSGNEG